MTLPRRRILQLAAGATALPALPRFAFADAYPSRPVQMIVPFPPGSAPDIVARLSGQWLSERLGQNFVVENRPGAGSNIGTEIVVRAEPDGYTILADVLSNVLNASLYHHLSFNFMRDIAPVATVANAPYVVLVTQSLPAKTIPGADRLRQGQSGQDQLRVRRHRHGIPYLRPVVHDHGRHRAGARALPHQLHARLDQRPGADGDQSDSAIDGIRQSRQGARAGGDDEGAAGRAARPADRRTNSCPATRRSAGTASAHRRTRRATSSTSSTRPSTPRSNSRRQRRGLPLWASSRCGRRRPNSQQFLAAENEKWGNVIRAANIKLD